MENNDHGRANGNTNGNSAGQTNGHACGHKSGHLNGHPIDDKNGETRKPMLADGTAATDERLTRLQKIVRACQYGVIGALERFFTWYGELVATHPKRAIAVCIVATLLGGLGLIRFYEEGDAASLVIPRNSEFRKNVDWLDNNFPREIRIHSVLYKAENVLTPAVIQAVYKQRRLLQTLTFANKTLREMCIKVPILKVPEGGIRFEQSEPSVTNKPEEDWGLEDEFQKEGGSPTLSPNASLGSMLKDLIPDEINLDTLERYSNDYYPFPYCAAARSIELGCLENNIVELWADNGNYNEVSDRTIAGLSELDILNSINNNNISQIFLKEKNFKELLGDIKYNAEGQIVGASALEIKFYTTVNITAFKLYGTASRGEKIDYTSYDFEGAMIQLLMNKTHFPAELTSYVNVQRQFFESFVGQTFKDVDKLAVGYAIVFIYVNIMLSKLNFVEQRIWLAIVGILSVLMGMILAYGICSAMGLFYSAAHTVIPFLLLGIGIDNIFVITQAYDTLDASCVPLSLTKRFGQTMKHAGVAVSVTSITDVFAFLVGANTVLPSLESFCVYAAVAIFVIYWMQVTHFVAWMSLDQRRINAGRDGCFCCITHTSFKSRKETKDSYLNKVFLQAGHLINKLYFKVVVLTLTVTFLVIGVWGTFSLTQEYLPEWLLPPESEVAQWFEARRLYYPSAGEPGFIMVKQIDIPKEFGMIDSLVKELESRKDNIAYVSSWHTEFRKYVEKYRPEDRTFEELISDDSFFRTKLAQFLFSPKGAIYQANFWFSGKLECGQPVPDILLQAIPFAHRRFERSAVWIPAMLEVEDIVRSIPFSNDSFPIALTYINWKTDAVVGTELLRNVGIALVCIFITTLITLGSWRGSLLVMMCVFLTCIDTTGFMHWWGLTVDITSMNVIIISVGLCVDFCAHIVHGFIIGTGTRKERILYIMENIAPAVMNGGFSTILALSLLVTSRSHIFISFFKILFMICMFGLFHGLVTLPVVLTILGPVDSQEDKKRSGKEIATETPIIRSTSGNGASLHASDDKNKQIREKPSGAMAEDEEMVPLNAGETEEMAPLNTGEAGANVPVKNEGDAEKGAPQGRRVHKRSKSSVGVPQGQNCTAVHDKSSCSTAVHADPTSTDT